MGEAQKRRPIGLLMSDYVMVNQSECCQRENEEPLMMRFELNTLTDSFP